MSDASLPPEAGGIPPLNVPEELILERVKVNAKSAIARLLSHALSLSIIPVDSENIAASVGPKDIVRRYHSPRIVETYGTSLDLKILSDYKIILSKKEGCRMLKELGVQGISDDYLNRHLNEKTYESMFGRDPCSISGRGKNKLLFTYSEIVYFYTDYLDKSVPEPIPDLPKSLVKYASEVEIHF
ncbi:MAG: hypothetical protein AAF609_08055 [Cyanobacteria bacterium P01_C01_bin.120]